jgi:hypothetical protein
MGLGLGFVGPPHSALPPQTTSHTSLSPLSLLRPHSQNKVLVGKIAGVNAPELETQVVDNANEAVEEE